MTVIPMFPNPIVGFVCLALIFSIYRRIMPRPIPGIPYRRSAVWTPLGDVPAMLESIKASGGQLWMWVTAQCEALNSPIVQLWIHPFTSKPVVVICDFREGQDVLMRRTKDFDRSQFFGQVFLPILPYHHISMATTEKMKNQKRLLSDTMGRPFLEDIAAPLIYGTAADMITLWRGRTELAKGRPWQAPFDIYGVALDAIWAATLGEHPGTTRSQLQLIDRLHKDGFSVPANKDQEVEFPHAKRPDPCDAILKLTSLMQIGITSPVPKLSYWWELRKRDTKKALAYKDKCLNDGLEEARRKFEDGGEKGSRINSALDHLLRKEMALAQKEGREPE
ncbi:MAG: hypothetical protein Q9227_005535 [Pyrenula ochraceoflavens]